MPELSRDLAEKVLAADTRNAITKVSEQGQLTTAQRLAVTKAALPANAVQQARTLALVKKWSRGERLSADELEEIRPALEASNLLPSEPPAATGEAASATPEPSKDFILLDAEPSRRTGLRYTLPHYATRYSVAIDTIKNWREKGRKKGTMPPLDDPSDLAVWWTNHMEWRVPDAILKAAQAPPAASSEPASQSSIPSTPAKPPAASDSPGVQIDITNMLLAKDEEVLQARSVVAGNYQLMLQALAGKGGDPVLTQRNWEKAQEVLRKVTKYAEERALRARDLLPRDAVEHDLAKLAEQLRGIDETTERRVMELCPNLTPEARAEVAAALRRVSGQRQRALENLDTTHDDFALAAA